MAWRKHKCKMKKTVFLPIVALIVMAFSFPDKGKIVMLDEFQKIADSAGLVFEMPVGYKESIVKENFDLPYQFAIKNKDEDFEVRYSVWPMTSLLADEAKCKADPNCKGHQDPNTMHKLLAMTT